MRFTEVFGWFVERKKVHCKLTLLRDSADKDIRKVTIKKGVVMRILCICK